jgi:hypothetical protein
MAQIRTTVNLKQEKVEVDRYWILLPANRWSLEDLDIGFSDIGIDRLNIYQLLIQT